MADPSGSQVDPHVKAEVKEEEIDASIEENINPNPQPDSMNLDGANDMDATIAPANIEPRIPAKKDATLREFMSKMDDYAPIIPDAVTNYYLSIAGLPPPPQTSPHLARLLALATQKFIADIAADAYQYSRIRSSNTSSANAMGLAPGVPGAAGGPAAGAAAASKEGSKGAALGVQRPGFGGGGQGGAGQGRTVLTMEDLGMAAGEYGVNVKRSEFYR
ncbi:transcription initiation factor IID, TAF10 subunit [Pseudovirgaria hyperparasitica]|uniref:Transcription initiation factor TFIID subunit 10 n=1 Tax=Pseudovirgaria hyperparasitica TaxID=470096 RepID=A0A6A6WJF4_9PEZI|nr:transcription initiation factor IID, TAF10 subunit [Pseudovirgaria hyperparasitica]KAF2761907.1 transcription initiation factor IID, TAF10 subunit [Pseudovirgaria hyperparasitica]